MCEDFSCQLPLEGGLTSAGERAAEAGVRPETQEELAGENVCTVSTPVQFTALGRWEQATAWHPLQYMVAWAWEQRLDGTVTPVQHIFHPLRTQGPPIHSASLCHSITYSPGKKD